ncbi:MAG: DUF2332 family protein [Pseudomonadota bacterium]
MSPEAIIDHFREQAAFCKHLGSPFTAALCELMANDLKAAGPVATLVDDWPTNPLKDALALRLCGALHHAALTDASPELAAAYPKSEAAWDMDTLWPFAQEHLTDAENKVREFLQFPPQTNETRRAIALLPGFLQIAAMFGKPLNLLELGASAGLNQNWEKFNYQTAAWQRSGSSDVIVDTDWRGPAPDALDQDIEIAARAACDQNPLNIHDIDATTRLKSYTWPDQLDRLKRFDAAVSLAREMDTTVEKADAAEWVRRKLGNLPPGQTTIVYHSVFLQYPPRDVIQDIITAIETAGINTTEAAPLAWLCFEPEGLFQAKRAEPRMITRLQTWPGGQTRNLSYSDGHATFVDSSPASLANT